LAGVASGIFKDFSIAKKKTEYVDLMEPDKKNHELYMDYFKVYKSVYNNLKNDFVDLDKLRNKYHK
jgi:xylulokinase